jgi:hypothetical protein
MMFSLSIAAGKRKVWKMEEVCNPILMMIVISSKGDFEDQYN